MLGSEAQSMRLRAPSVSPPAAGRHQRHGHSPRGAAGARRGGCGGPRAPGGLRCTQSPALLALPGLLPVPPSCGTSAPQLPGRCPGSCPWQGTWGRSGTCGAMRGCDCSPPVLGCARCLPCATMEPCGRRCHRHPQPGGQSRVPPAPSHRPPVPPAPRAAQVGPGQPPARCPECRFCWPGRGRPRPHAAPGPAAPVNAGSVCTQALRCWAPSHCPGGSQTKVALGLPGPGVLRAGAP